MDNKISETLDRMTRGASLLENLGAIVLHEVDKLDAADHENLARVLFQVDVICDQMKEAKKNIDTASDILSRSKIPDAMRAAHVKNFTLADINRRVQLGRRWGATILNKEAGFKWLRDNEYGSLITETVNASSLAALGKNLVETEGKELPDDIFKTSVMTYTSLVKL